MKKQQSILKPRQARCVHTVLFYAPSIEAACRVVRGGRLCTGILCTCTQQQKQIRCTESLKGKVPNSILTFASTRVSAGCLTRCRSGCRCEDTLWRCNPSRLFAQFCVMDGSRVHICILHAQWNAKHKYEVTISSRFHCVGCCSLPCDIGSVILTR